MIRKFARSDASLFCGKLCRKFKNLFVNFFWVTLYDLFLSFGYFFNDNYFYFFEFYTILNPYPFCYSTYCGVFEVRVSQGMIEN